MLAPRDPVAARVSSEVALSDRRMQESMTLSRLAAIERSLNDFIQAKRRIPQALDELVPEFLAEIPEVVLGIRGINDTRSVRRYPPETIQDGQINGALLDNTGGWGYVYNRDQVIVFVDSTAKRLDGSLWYKARGVY
jgi:hypothetical protein